MVALALIQGATNVDPTNIDMKVADASASLAALGLALPEDDILREAALALSRCLARRVRASQRFAARMGLPEFLPVVIEDGREVGVRERADIRSTYERAAEEASERADRAQRTNPTARGAVLRRHVGPWEGGPPTSSASHRRS